MSYGFDLLKKWSFVPITLEREDGIPIFVTDLDENGKRRIRKLDTGDFRFTEKTVPNWLMLTYVGATEIYREIDLERQRSAVLVEALKKIQPLFDDGLKCGEEEQDCDNHWKRFLVREALKKYEEMGK